jgi:predicted DNA-binding protein with PD1-like motif
MVEISGYGKPLWLLCLTFVLFNACNYKKVEKAENKIVAFRLKPGEDLKEGIERVVNDNKISAGWIAAAVGSLTEFAIRFANQPDISTGKGHFEIVSLSGTVSIYGSHLHISISDSTGHTIGGHLASGSKVYTTAEIIIQSAGQYEFKREKDGTTPWEELQIREK